MALLNFFKTPRNQRYEYKPRFWDPDKEKRKERLKYLESIKGNSAEAAKNRIKGGFKRGHISDNEVRSRAVAQSNKMLLIIIIVLICLSYVFLTVYLPDLLESLG